MKKRTFFSLSLILPLAAFAVFFLIGLFAVPSMSMDSAMVFQWFGFPFVSFAACGYFALRFSPVWTWILPVLSWLLEAKMVGGGLGILDCPTLWLPVVGYIIGIIWFFFGKKIWGWFSKL